MTVYTDALQPATAIAKSIGGITVLTSNVIDIGGKTAADEWTLFTVPAGAMVLSAVIVILEDAGETCTFDIGVNGGTVDGLINGADLNQAAGTCVSAVSGTEIGVTAKWDAAEVVSALAVTGSTYAAGKFQVTVVLASAGA